MSSVIRIGSVSKVNYEDGTIEVTYEDLSLIHISEPTRRTPISYAVFCLKKKIFLVVQRLL